MDEKTMNASKKNILLRSFFMRTTVVILTIVVLLCSSVSVLAASYVIKYPDDYPYTLVETADGYRFTVDTSDSCYWERYRDDSLRFTYTGSTVDGSSMLNLIDNISFLLYPFGKDTFVPLSGLNADFATNFNIVFDASMVVPEDFKIIVKSAYGIIDSSGTDFFTEFRTLLTFDYSVGSDGFGFGIDSADVEISSGDLPVSIVYLVEFEGIDAESDNTSIPFRISQDTEVSFIVTDAFVESLQHDELKDRLDGMIDKQQQTNNKLDDIEQGIVGPGGTNDKLDDIEQGIVGPGGTNDKLDDIEQGIVGPGGTNDKLDDIGGSLETLPGEIGDEIQGVIDNEKQEAEEGGNKFVDQLLDLLPDPSTGVLASMRGLTNATSYTGTEAKFALPSLTIPAIGDLVPETVLWEGAEMDFGEYFEMLPPTLLTLVRSLFTIAIVLYCAYELKGIISFVFTLKGGGK